MKFISKQKFFNRYLPMLLSVVLIVIASFAYLIFRPQTPVAEAAIALDHSQYNSGVGGGSPGPGSYSYTVSGANPILFVAVTVDSSQTVSGVTYNGVSMTQTDSIAVDGTHTNYLFMLQAPATGAHNVSISYSGSPNVAALTVSYDGAAQSGQPDAHKSDSQTNDPTTVSLTTVQNNSWMVMFSTDTNIDALSITAGGTLRVGKGGNTFAIFDSNGSVGAAGSHSMTIEHTYGIIALKSLVASFAPAPKTGDFVQQGGKFRQVGGRVVIGGGDVQNQLDTDTFSGTNGNVLPTYSANWPWWGSGDFNQCRIEGSPGVGDNNGCGDSRTGQTWTNDQWAELKVDSANTPSGFFVCVRTTSPANNADGYCGGIDIGNFNNQYRIVKITNGIPTSLAASAITLALNDVVNMQVVGTTLKLTVNGTVLLTTTDSTYSTGNPGLHFYSGNANRLGGSWRAGSVSHGHH